LHPANMSASMMRRAPAGHAADTRPPARADDSDAPTQ
jgi:hypothetical protein